MKSFLIVFLVVVGTSALVAQDIHLVVSKSRYTVSVYRGDSLIAAFRVAVGKHSGDKQRRGDNRTPVGQFAISQIQRSHSWVHDFGDGKGPVSGAYGPWFLRLKTPRWTGIGIHGTHDPSSIGTMATEGCIRLRNEDLLELKDLVKVGTPVTIEP